MTWILGVNVPPVGWHDTAACLIDETGRVHAMAEEERFTRTKHGAHEQPRHAVAFCLQQAGVRAEEVDVVAVGWDAPRMFEAHGMRWGYGEVDRLLEGIGLAVPCPPDVVFVPHHRAHAMAAWYGSAARDAAIVVVDGNGEDESVSIFEAREGQPVLRRARWPRASSLGLMYAVVSEVLGFGLLGAGKTMGLASYGRVARVEPWPMLDAELGPPFPLTPESSYDEVMTGWRKYVATLLDGPVEADTDLLPHDAGAVRLAVSAQAAVEAAMRHLVASARAQTGLADVCLAGGVALNCSANGLLPSPVHVPPVPHDAGVAVGAAWSVCGRRPADVFDPFVGEELVGGPVGPHRAAPLRIDRVVELLRAGAIGAIASGRAEVGPRALGHRSIIALPRTVEVRDTINRRKGREPWRPLAPAARLEDAGRFWRVIPELQRYMLGATMATPEGQQLMPAAVHVDGTVRAQVVQPADGGPLHEILGALADAGEPPVVINTSLNTRGEPLVNTAAEALRAFDAIALDFLVLGDRLVER